METDFEITKGSRKEINTSSWWEQFSPYWPVLLLLLTVTIGCAWYYLKSTPETYEIKSAVLIKDEKKGVDDSKMVEGLNQLSGTKIIENEIEVITSHTLLNEVVTRLRLYAPLYEKTKWKTFSAYTSSPIVVEMSNPDRLKEQKSIPFRYDSVAKKVIIDNEEYPVGEITETPFGRLRFSPNENYEPVSDSAEASSFYFALVKPKRATEQLAQRLQAASANKLSSVIDLRFTDDNPKRGEDILNLLVTAYNNAAIKDRNLLADSTLAFLDERIRLVSGELQKIESKAQTYKSSRDVVDISSQGKLFLQNVSDNDQKVAEINMQLAVLDQVEKSIQSTGNSADAIPSALVVNDPLLAQRLEKLYNAEMEYEKMKKSTAENNPLMTSLRSQIDKIKPGIYESVRNQRNSLLAGRTSLMASSNKYTSALQSVPEKEKDLIEISRDQSSKANLYNYLSQKREEIALSHSSLLPNSRIVDTAQAAIDPISPSNKIAYSAAVIVAFVLFIGLILFREIFNNTILYRQEIENNTSAPVIAEIPYQSKNSPLVIGKYESTFVAEQFRKLRTSLGYLGISPRRKKILVTSVIPGEGKSFIAANLGLSLALTGKKVLLLEFDLVNPGLSPKFGVYDEKGVSSYLNGETEPEEIIKRTEQCADLFIIPAGHLPPNPSEIITSKKTEQLLQYAEAIFDYVIIDTAPVGLRSDAYVLSKLCNATLYVVRHKKTPKKSIRRIDENNKVNELKNMAIVFNGVKPKGFSKHNYSYGYDYKYAGKYQAGKLQKSI